MDSLRNPTSEKRQKAQGFINQQIRLHGKADDVLHIIKRCAKKLDTLKEDLDAWDAGSEALRLTYALRLTLVNRITFQRLVLSRLEGYYCSLLCQLLEPAMRHAYREAA